MPCPIIAEYLHPAQMVIYKAIGDWFVAIRIGLIDRSCCYRGSGKGTGKGKEGDKCKFRGKGNGQGKRFSR